jgi:LacI family transcriptional regulator, galactose operon repressor
MTKFRHFVRDQLANRPTIADVAKACGLSVSTVDRVLNGREHVRAETSRRVYEAAHQIGYHAANAIKQRLLAELPAYRFGFLLQKEKQSFYREFAHELREAVRVMPGIRGQAEIVFAQSQSPDEQSALLSELAARSDAVAATAVNDHKVSAAVADIKARGIPCFALLNDFAQGIRQNYIGLNNLKIGRIAAWMLSTAAKAPGKVAIFVGGHRWHGHELRETGFRSYFREFAPQFHVLDTLVNLETRQVTYEATLDLMHRNSDLAGIYVAGGGMEGAIHAVREQKKPGEVALIVNELTAVSRTGLQEHYVTMVGATPLPQLCSALVDLMARSLNDGFAEMPGQYFLQPSIHLPESL